jgi:hypothetical protein
MSVGRFDRELELPSQGDVTIKGPFDPNDPEVDGGKILFLIVQGEDENAVIVEGEGTWQKGDHEWSGKTKRHGKNPAGKPSSDELQPGVARGIALSVVIKPGKVFAGGSKFDPPAIEALTWCADFKFVGSVAQT